jgi:hypothetical protein
VGGYYGLTDWFDKTGYLTKEYKEKIPQTKSKDAEK